MYKIMVHRISQNTNPAQVSKGHLKVDVELWIVRGGYIYIYKENSRFWWITNLVLICSRKSSQAKASEDKQREKEKVKLKRERESERATEREILELGGERIGENGGSIHVGRDLGLGFRARGDLYSCGQEEEEQ